jgi:hypothetical protein
MLSKLREMWVDDDYIWTTRGLKIWGFTNKHWDLRRNHVEFELEHLWIYAKK